MPDGSIVNVRDNGSYHQFHFLAGLPGGLPAIRFDSIDDGTGIWYDPDTKALKFRFGGVDTYTFDDAGGISMTVGGRFLAGDGTALVPSLALASDDDGTGTGVYRRAANSWTLSINGVGTFEYNSSGLSLISGTSLMWRSGDITTAADVLIQRDAAGTLSQRNGANAQLYQLYTNYTDGSNYRRVALGNDGIIMENAGSGGNGLLSIYNRTGGAGIQFGTNNVARWNVNVNGHLVPQTDAIPDVGDATHFVKDLYYRRRMTKIAVVTYSASMTPDAALGDMQVITITNGTAFTINAPTNPLTGQWMELMLRNTSGGAAGAATWNAVYKMAAWTNPANATSRSITFRYDGSNWVETGRTTVDVPN